MEATYPCSIRKRRRIRCHWLLGLGNAYYIADQQEKPEKLDEVGVASVVSFQAILRQLCTNRKVDKALFEQFGPETENFQSQFVSGGSPEGSLRTWLSTKDSGNR